MRQTLSINTDQFQGSTPVIEGKKVSIMQNAKGVTIHLTAHQEGLQLSAGAGGLDFQIK